MAEVLDKPPGAVYVEVHSSDRPDEALCGQLTKQEPLPGGGVAARRR